MARPTDLTNRFWFERAGDLGLQYFRGDRPTRYPGHRQSEYVLVFCLRGEIEVTEGAQRLTLRPGEVLIGNPGRRRSSIYGVHGGECEGITLIARPEVVAGRLARLGARPRHGGVSSLLGQLTPRDLLPIAQLAADGLRPGASADEMALEGASRLLLSEALRQWPRELIRETVGPGEGYLPRPEFVRAIAWMHGIGYGEFSVERLCGELGLERERFEEQFGRSTGATVRQQFEEVLAARTADLLARYGGNEREVAREVGFSGAGEMWERLGNLSARLSENIP